MVNGTELEASDNRLIPYVNLYFAANEIKEIIGSKKNRILLFVNFDCTVHGLTRKTQWIYLKQSRHKPTSCEIGKCSKTKEMLEGDLLNLRMDCACRLP